MADATPAGGTVKMEKTGAVAVLTLSYPERRNALSLTLREHLHDRLFDAMNDPEVKVLVLTGEGAHFCSGGDLSSFDGVTPAGGRARMQRVQRVVRLLVNGEKPVIAAIEGHAAGAGLSLSAACDIVVASSEAKFSCTFNRIGLVPDLGGLWTLPARMGLGRAKMMVMSGRVLDAKAAEAQGLVDEIVEPGKALEAAVALAQQVAATAPLSNGATKAILNRGLSTLDQVLAAEADAQGVMYGSEDFVEGRAAFLEKRKAVFQGR
jgi:2-(1,2-epoxy-1,2-dihydrophenyl)acetyl-CoA isomerase